MSTGVPFIVWGSALLAAVSLLLSIGYAKFAKRAGWAVAYLVIAIVLAFVSAASAAFVAGGGSLTP